LRHTVQLDKSICSYRYKRRIIFLTIPINICVKTNYTSQNIEVFWKQCTSFCWVFEGHLKWIIVLVPRNNTFKYCGNRLQQFRHEAIWTGKYYQWE
jgi:hypothetical protein